MMALAVVLFVTEWLRVDVVALLVPVERPDREENASDWASLDVLAAEIGARWPEGISSVEAVAEGRR